MLKSMPWDFRFLLYIYRTNSSYTCDDGLRFLFNLMNFFFFFDAERIQMPVCWLLHLDSMNFLLFQIKNFNLKDIYDSHTNTLMLR